MVVEKTAARGRDGLEALAHSGAQDLPNRRQAIADLKRFDALKSAVTKSLNGTKLLKAEADALQRAVDVAEDQFQRVHRHSTDSIRVVLQQTSKSAAPEDSH